MCFRQMRVCLFWNETAGEGISLDELRAHITRAGHTVTRVVERSKDLRDHLHHDFDVVAAAGGDGTIASAGRALAGDDIPLAILPLGTANNIATSLSIGGELDQLIARWSLDRVARIDIGSIDSSAGSGFFLESVGFGLVARAIDEARRTIAKDDPQTHLDDAKELFSDLLERLEPERYSLTIADQHLSGDYLLIEVLNTPLIGPQLELTPDVSPADGLLSVVTVSADERSSLAGYLEALRNGSSAVGAFKSWRVPGIDIRGAATVMHVDDALKTTTGGVVSIRVSASPLLVLA
jgi:diacylglycerol kinase family enzyme